MNSVMQSSRMYCMSSQRMTTAAGLDANQFFGMEANCETDELGLRHLGNFYAPHLMYDIERLFLVEEAPGTMKSVWDDFEHNGQESDLDDLDRLFRGINSKPKSPAMSLSADESDSSSAGSVNGAQQAMDDIVNKARLIEILRERERLQRLKPKKPQKKTTAAKVCVFCRNNGEAEAVYSSHQLKDPEGNVTCPVLYIYTCPICGASGKSAHTVKYCPYNTGDTLGVNLLADLTHDKRLHYL